MPTPTEPASYPPAGELVLARINQLESEGYFFEGCMQSTSDAWVMHVPFYGADLVVHSVPETFEDPLEGLDYLADRIKKAKLIDCEVVYVLEAGIETAGKLKDLAEEEARNQRNKVSYKPGATAFFVKPKLGSPH